MLKYCSVVCNMYDIAFVGAGISSLYAVYKALKYDASIKVVILEKNRNIGGRVAWGKFSGIDVVKGAGIGRFDKDKHLIKLLDELNVPYTVKTTQVAYYKTKSPASSLLQLINAMSNDNSSKRDAFKQFGQNILGKKEYEAFKRDVGYTDYETLDVDDAIHNYGFEDTYGSNKTFGFSWKFLIQRLKEFIGPNVIISNTEIVRLDFTSPTKHITLYDAIGNSWVAQKVCIGTTISSLYTLLPTFSIFRYISSQPFIRIYARLNKALPIGPGYTVVSNEFQKIIGPFGKHNDNIYMLAYADNLDAKILHKATKKQLQDKLQSLFGDTSLQIQKYVKYYWQEGTHAYIPLNKKYSSRNQFIRCAQHPRKNVYVIGEVVAMNQGWVSPALQTVHNIESSLYR